VRLVLTTPGRVVSAIVRPRRITTPPRGGGGQTLSFVPAARCRWRIHCGRPSCGALHAIPVQDGRYSCRRRVSRSSRRRLVRTAPKRRSPRRDATAANGAGLRCRRCGQAGRRPTRSCCSSVSGVGWARTIASESPARDGRVQLWPVDQSCAGSTARAGRSSYWCAMKGAAEEAPVARARKRSADPRYQCRSALARARDADTRAVPALDAAYIRSSSSPAHLPGGVPARRPAKESRAVQVWYHAQARSRTSFGDRAAPGGTVQLYRPTRPGGSSSSARRRAVTRAPGRDLRVQSGDAFDITASDADGLRQEQLAPPSAARRHASDYGVLQSRFERGNLRR